MLGVPFGQLALSPYRAWSIADPLVAARAGVGIKKIAPSKPSKHERREANPRVSFIALLYTPLIQNQSFASYANDKANNF